jgi:hypothetical protein
MFSAQPRGITLHNEVAAMTHDIMLIHNFPGLYDENEFSVDFERMADMMQRFAEMKRREPDGARDGREQIMRWLGEILQARREVGNR